MIPPSARTRRLHASQDFGYHERMDKKPNAKALLPIVVFLVLYLGCGIYFEYIAPAEGQMGFYVVSVVVAFVIALIVALLQNRSLSFDEKIHVCARGIGDDNIVIMLFIFLMAGAFSASRARRRCREHGNLFLDILPGRKRPYPASSSSPASSRWPWARAWAPSRC